MGSSTVLRDVAVVLREAVRRLEVAGAESSPDQAIAEVQQALDAAAAQIARCRSEDDPAPPPASLQSARGVERSLRITQQSVDVAPIAIFRLDGEGRVMSVNQEACRCLGYTPEELLALTIYDFDANVTPTEWRAHRALTKASGSRTLTTTHRRKDGSMFPVEVSVKQFTFDGEICSISFAKDITERVNAEQERRKLETRMLQAQKLESLGVLAGGIAHDFNNLLMVILGNLELALAAIPPTVNETAMLRDADHAARQAADLCRQLLIYAGKGNSRVEPTDLGALLREQTQMLEVSASKSIRLLLNLAEQLPPINADVSQLRQVFMNLIINASDAIGQRAGVISITTSVLSCDQAYLDRVESAQPLSPGRYVSVEVTDTGCGMDEKVRSRIFDPFFTTKTTGRGLGLAAVRGIVNEHGGGISVYSEPGKGTTFRLLFPVPTAVSPVSQESAPIAPWRGSGLVLLIDDEAALRTLGSRMLNLLGFDALLARNGIEGLELFKQHKDRIRFVLLDWTMPEMGGGETLQELRVLNPNLPVILASGHAPNDVYRRVGSGRVSAVVRKPYTLDELAHAFEEISRSRQRT